MSDNLLSKNICYLLDHKIISADSLLKITGHTSPGLISMWKTGERTIMTPDLIKIANYLHYTIDQLVNQDLSKIKDDNDDLEKLYREAKALLTEDDKDTIKFILKKRISEKSD